MQRPLIVAGLCALAACGEAPTAPDVRPEPTAPVVSTVSVSSPIGEIIAAGGSAQLSAAAADGNGGSVTASFVWTSADASVATVSSTGTVTGVGVGATTITATADGVNGTLDLSVADADLRSLRAVLDDPLAVELIAGIGGGAGSPLSRTWSSCDAALSTGNLAALRDCAVDGRLALADDTDPTTSPLRSLLGLFLDWVERLLNLT